MNTMDNAKVIEAVGKYAVQKYLQKLMISEMHKLTLFSIFPQSGAPNLSDPHHLILIKDLSKMIDLNSGSYHN
jgi:hypothetical protein